jgi:hypothetical protein
MSKTREGLSQLLAQHPTADVVEIRHQKLKAQAVAEFFRQMQIGSPYFHEPEGPWTSITLYEDGKYIDFAIWNLTGNVYVILEDGTVADDPFIWITRPNQIVELED